MFEMLQMKNNLNFLLLYYSIIRHKVYLCVPSCFTPFQLFVSPGTELTRLLCPWNSPGKNTEVGCRALQGIVLTQGLNPGLLHCRQILYPLSHVSFNFMAAITICSDFGAQKNKVLATCKYLVHCY